jgi:hypothetical protein
MFSMLYAPIRWDIIQFYLLILFIGSWGAMVGHIYKSNKPGEESLRSFLDRCSLGNYIEVSRSETGSIGIWFWIFVASLFLFVVVSIHSLNGDYPGTGVKFDGDCLWPIL